MMKRRTPVAACPTPTKSEPNNAICPIVCSYRENLSLVDMPAITGVDLKARHAAKYSNDLKMRHNRNSF